MVRSQLQVNLQVDLVDKVSISWLEIFNTNLHVKPFVGSVYVLHYSQVHFRVS